MLDVMQFFGNITENDVMNKLSVEQMKKLPNWAKDYIIILEANLARTEEKLKQSIFEHSKNGNEKVLLRLDINEVVVLHDNAHISFKINDHQKIDVNLNTENGTTFVEVFGASNLNINPRASNHCRIS